MVLEYQGTHIIGVSPATSGTDPRAKPSKFSEVARDFGPFRRIATSAIPVVSIAATADTDENVTVTYVDQLGVRQVIICPAMSH